MYEVLLNSVFASLDPERAHDRALSLLERTSRHQSALAALKAAFGPRVSGRPVRLMGLDFMHRLGLAGGFDKDARAIPALAALGFSFIEIGTVTPRLQPGNPKPRVFRLADDRAIINRMGFPSAGAAMVRERLAGGGKQRVPVFVSLGKNKDTPLERAAEDYLAVLEQLHDFADAAVVNISSPNTPELRRLQTVDYLGELLSTLRSATLRLAGEQAPKPLLIKISPDLDWNELDQLLELATANRVAGIIATNTTTGRDGLRDSRRGEMGGLSGRPLTQRSNNVIRHIVRQTGNRLPVVGVGGVFSGRDLDEKLEAGASLVQAYTGFIYRGPAFVRTVLREYETARSKPAIGAEAAHNLS